MTLKTGQYLFINLFINDEIRTIVHIKDFLKKITNDERLTKMNIKTSKFTREFLGRGGQDTNLCAKFVCSCLPYYAHCKIIAVKHGACSIFKGGQRNLRGR